MRQCITVDCRLPELPEVEAVRQRLIDERLAGATIVSFAAERPGTTKPQRPQAVAKAVRGRVVEGIRRRGKHLFIDLSGGYSIRVHLRMTGNLRIIPDARLRPATARGWFVLDDGRALILDDPRALGTIHAGRLDEMEAAAAAVGVEPLSDAFTDDLLLGATRRSKKPIKTLLMDQRAVAGLGNIYAAEALFRAGIDPRRESRRTSALRLRRLRVEIVRVLADAVQSTRIAYRAPGRFGEADSFPLLVYDREGEKCGNCGRIIRRIPQGGRSTYFCPHCQR